MGLDLPGPLERLLNDLGFTWPEVDEMDLFSTGSSWMQAGGTLNQLKSQADQTAQSVVSSNHGPAVDAFVQKYSGDNAPSAVLGEAAVGVQVGGGAILMCAGIVLALKINTIINLAILLAEIISAIAEAAVTFGASLAEIPIFKEITQRIIQAIINEAVTAILS